MLSTTGTRRRTMVLAAALAGALLLGACQEARPSVTPQGAVTSGTSTPATPSAPSATVTISPADGAQGVRPDEPVTVTVEGGVVDSVVVQTGSSDPVPGEVSADG